MSFNQMAWQNIQGCLAIQFSIRIECTRKQDPAIKFCTKEFETLRYISESAENLEH